MLAAIFSPRGLRVAVPAMVLGLLAAGTLFSTVEGVSAWDGIWWAVTTVTTVGDGRFTPETVAGRLIGIAVMVLGVGFLLILAGSLVEHFVRVEETDTFERLAEIEGRLDRVQAELELIRAADIGRDYGPPSGEVPMTGAAARRTIGP